MSQIMEKCLISQCWRIFQEIPRSGCGGRWLSKCN